MIARGEAGYPEGLLQARNPPRRLFCLGNEGLLHDPSLSIVGARRSTPYGRGLARRFAKAAAQQGIVIVSGGAYGCDSEAHKAALDAGGATIVVLGGGCDNLYPANNLPLFQRVVDSGGLLVSEQEWGAPPLPYMFRERNRIIAGLSRATLIVEAGLPSGTFSTADEALAANREVFAVPGAITSPASRGANQLIAQGAHPVNDDEAFGMLLTGYYGVLQFTGAAATRSGSGRAGGACSPAMEDDELLAALSAEALSVDELVDVGIPVPKGQSAISWLMLRLSELECAGLVERCSDGRYGRTT